MEEYLKILMEQIRCKKAHPYIRQEIQGHMEDQIEANLMDGMTDKEAEEAAVKDMGNPVEVGISLDRIHRPAFAWGMVGLMAVISIAAIVIQQILWNQMGENAIGSSHFMVYTIIGFLLMLLVYYVDYSMIARYSKLIAGLFLGICILGLWKGQTIHGFTYYLQIGGINIPLASLLILYVPIYAAVIYKYHGKGYGALIKSLCWMVIPTWIAFRLPSISLAMLLLVSMSVVLTVALAQDWFRVAKKRVIAALWICEIGFPIVSLFCALLFGALADYQVARIQAFIHNSGDANYTTNQLRTILSSSQMVGNSGKDLTECLPSFNSDFILSYVFSTYGLLIGTVICCILGVLIVKIFSISFRQKNQLGMCMGCGCGTILLLNTLANVGECMGCLPITQTFLPFFSTGSGNIIVCYVLMGIILSIYRYKNVYPAHVDTKLPRFKMTIDL